MNAARFPCPIYHKMLEKAISFTQSEPGKLGSVIKDELARTLVASDV